MGRARTISDNLFSVIQCPYWLPASSCTVTDTPYEVHILVRESGERIGSFDRSGRNAGDFHWVHNIAIDTQGSVYTAEVDTGKRAQRFRRVQ